MRRRRPLTLLIISEEKGRTYEYRIRRLYLWGLAAAAAGVLALLAVGLRAWERADHFERRAQRLERDKAILAEEVASITEVEEFLRGLKLRNDRLRRLTAEAFGVGRPEEVEPMARESFISMTNRLRHGGGAIGRGARVHLSWPVEASILLRA